MHRPHHLKSAAALVALGALLAGCSNASGAADQAAAAPEAAAPVTGQGIGDPYYPDDGNLGYNVKGYLVDLDYDRPTQRIAATTTITSRSTAKLTRFHLDLIGMKVSRVKVAGQPATFTRTDAHELVIKPAKPIPDDQVFVTKVTYAGKPGRDPVGTVPSGWYDATTRGAGFIAGEPHSCTLWYPCNDHPTDKATFELIATVPRPFAVVSNGVELPVHASVDEDGTRVRTYHWRLGEATATYLTTIYIDKLTFERSKLADGTPVVSAYGPKQGPAVHAREARLPEILDVLADAWGPYPAPQAGGIFVHGDVPFSLETFTRPIYTEGVDIATIAHENGHQWWGDNVSIKRWRDICLNECFASYSMFLWLAVDTDLDLDAYYDQTITDDPGLFDAPLYDMGAGNEFDYEGVYYKGPLMLHALRNLLGDDAFFGALQEIQAEHAGGNISMLQLRDILSRKTGVDLDSFWDEWVLNTGIPSDENLHPGNL